MEEFLLAFFYHDRSQKASVERRIADARHDEWNGADMVEVAVGYDDGADLFLSFLDVFCVRQYVVDARRVLVLELEADVDDDDIVAAFDHGAVFADLFDAAERDDADRIWRERRNDLRSLLLLCQSCFCQRWKNDSGGGLRPDRLFWRGKSTVSAAESEDGTRIWTSGRHLARGVRAMRSR